MREKILILHGAIGSKDRFDKIADKLDKKFDVLRMNFTGHGGEPIPTTPFSIELFTKNVLDFLNKHEIISIHIFGYSMGGFVALYFAEFWGFPRVALFGSYLLSLGLLIGARMWSSIWRLIVNQENDENIAAVRVAREGLEGPVLVIGGGGYIGSALVPRRPRPRLPTARSDA